MKIPSNVAIVTDFLLALGGADRLLDSLLKIFPDAVIFTSKYSPDSYPQLKDSDVRTTFLQNPVFKLPILRHSNPIVPLAFEQLDLSDFDLVISVSAGYAKGVIPDLSQKHISIVLTPPRYLWDGEFNVRGRFLEPLYRLVSLFTHTYQRVWDLSTMNRIDDLVSISQFIKDKVKKVYSRDSVVIYPGIDEKWFDAPSRDHNFDIPDDYLLIVSRLYDYKNIDWAIEAVKETGDNLVIVGDGPDMKYLQKLSKGFENIYFLGYIEDDEIVKSLYAGARAFLFCGIEDFGLTPVEAMASGIPVLALNKGGVTETVVEGKTGQFFNSMDGLKRLLKEKEWEGYNRKEIVNRAKAFTEEQFIKNFRKYLREL